jgi:hypothetical protein
MPNYDAIAKRWGLNPRIFRALIRQESGGRQSAKSPAGAIGLSQLMPATAKGLGVDPYDPQQNLEGGAKYLRQQLDRFGGDYRKALAAYNAGPGAVQKYGGVPPYRETQNYVRTILDSGDVPLASSKGSAGASAGTRTITRTVTPGVDNSGVRAGLIQQFLSRSHMDPLDFALGIHGAQDVAPVTRTSTVRTPASASGGTTSVHGKSPLLELFWQGAGGINAKDGKRVPQGFVSGHKDHVHVAAGPKTVVQLGKLAQSMGLNVGENPHFGKVNPVHVQNSYHYKGEAIDVSGDPARMRAYAHRVAKLYGIR